jgi:hypothetical protein
MTIHFKKRSILFSLFLLFVAASQAQPGKSDNLIQFSGVVVTGDSLMPVPFVNVIIDQSNRGTMTDLYGYFSFVAQKGDSISFSALGFKRHGIVIPDTLVEKKYSMIEILYADTLLLSEMVIYPWPTKEQFKEAFLALEVPETDAERAARNLTQAAMYERMMKMPADGSENFKYQMQNYQNKIYYAGQAPPINIFNPFAWAKFVEAWRDGAFKKKEHQD